MSTRDEQIGKNLARLRGDVSQKDLAARMKQLGWKWSQATVWTIETGERPLRLAEADDLANILEMNTWEFLRTDADYHAREYVQRSWRALEDLRAAQSEFEGSRRLLKSHVADFPLPDDLTDEFESISNVVVHVIVP